MPQTNIGNPHEKNTIAPIAYTIIDAASVSGFSRSRLYDEIAAGRLRAVKAGKRTLIFADSLRTLLEALPSAPIGKGAKSEDLEAGNAK